MGPRAARGFGQYSGVARAVERIGERWALLIVRDLLVGARRYSDLKTGLPRIPTNILSDRLKELQQAGVVRRVPTVRGGYELTPRGRALEPVILELERWGWSALGEPADDEVVTHDALTVALRSAFQPEVAAGTPPTEYVLHVHGGTSVSVVVTGDRLDVVPIGPDALPRPRPGAGAEVAAEARVEFVVTPTEFRDLLTRLMDPCTVQILAGECRTLEQFARTFRIDTGGPALPPAEEMPDGSHAHANP